MSSSALAPRALWCQFAGEKHTPHTRSLTGAAEGNDTAGSGAGSGIGGTSRAAAANSANAASAAGVRLFDVRVQGAVLVGMEWAGNIMM